MAASHYFPSLQTPALPTQHNAGHPHSHSTQLLLLWGNTFSPVSSRALADALAAPQLRRLRSDLRSYVVDGEVALALQDVAE